jgi:hypothetical protein
MNKNKIVKQWWVVFAAIFSLAICLFWFRNGLIKATGESGLFFSILERQLNLSLNTWADSTIGETPFSFNGSIPLLVLLNVLNQFLPDFFVQAMFFAMCIFFAIVGVGGLLKMFKPDTKQFLLLAAGVAYCFNPYSIVFIWNRFLYNYTFAYCLIPLLLFLFLRMVLRPSLRKMITFFSVSLLGSFAFTGIAYFLVFLGMLSLLSIYLLIISNEKKRMFFSIAITGLVFISSQLFWLLPFYAGNRLGVGQSTGFFSEQGNLHTTMKLSEYYGGILNKLTMVRADMPELAYEDVPWAVWYSKSLVTTTTLISVLVIVVGLVSLFKFNLRHKWFLTFSFLASLLFINGTSLPLSNLYLLIYKISPTLGALRNPYEKAGFAFYLVAFLVWGALLSSLGSRKNKGPFYVLLSASLIWWLVMAVPIFDGRVFTYKHITSNDPRVGFSVDIPNYYNDLSAQVDTDNKLTRVMALPLTGEGVVHKWNFGYDGVESYNGLLNKAAISLDTTTGQLPQIAKYLKSAGVEQTLSAARLLNVSDIIIRNDIVMPVDSPTSSQLIESIDPFSDVFDKKQEFGDSSVYLYSLKDNLVAPRIYAADSNSLVYINKIKFDPNLIDKNQTTVNSTSKDADMYYPATNFVEPIEVIRPSYESNQLVPLPHVSHQRFSRLYPLVRLREDFWKLTNGFELLPITMTLSYKRLVEIEPLISDQSSQKLLENALDDYKSSIEDLIKEANYQILVEGGNRPFWELVMFSHLKRLEEYSLKASQNKDLLNEVIKEVNSKIYQANVFPFYDNQLQGDKDRHVVYRYVFDGVLKGNYKINLLSKSGNLDFVGGIQINNINSNLTKISSDSYSVPFTTDLEKNEIRVKVETKSETILNEERSLSSLSQEGKKSRFKIPSNVGQGQLLLSFRYKIVRGNGPRVEIYRSINESRPIVGERYPTDTYDFDWKYKTISIPTNSTTGELYVDFIAEPSNDCQKSNPYDLECKNQSFREVYDRHTDFLIDDLVATYQPKIEVNLQKSEKVDLVKGMPIPLSFTRLNPAMYVVEVKDKSNIVLLEQFHPGWQLYGIKNDVGGELINEYGEYGVSEFKSNSSLLKDAILSIKTLISRSSYDQNNQKYANGYANIWNDVEEGVYLLHFNPQRLFYLGIFATIILSISLACVIIVYEKKK